MASFSDYYTPTAGSQGGAPGSSTQALPFTLANYDITQQNATEDAGLAQSQLGTQFGINLTNLQNAYNSRGTDRGGQAGVAADQLRATYDWQNADVSRQLARQVADLNRARVLSTIGVMT